MGWWGWLRGGSSGRGDARQLTTRSSEYALPPSVAASERRRFLRPAEPMPPSMEIVHGDLLDQPVEAIVNAWNRNVIPWWLLLPQGVSGAIKRRAGYAPFRELARHGPIPLGGAVLTSAGNLPFKGIIHVAGISMLWRSSETSIRRSVTNALLIAEEHGFRSVGMPLIGAGTGGGNEDVVQAVIEHQLATVSYAGHVVVVRYAPRGSVASSASVR